VKRGLGLERVRSVPHLKAVQLTRNNKPKNVKTDIKYINWKMRANVSFSYRLIFNFIFIISGALVLSWLLSTARSSCPECIPWFYLAGATVVAGSTGVLGYLLHK